MMATSPQFQPQHTPMNNFMEKKYLKYCNLDTLDKEDNNQKHKKNKKHEDYRHQLLLDYKTKNLLKLKQDLAKQKQKMVKEQNRNNLYLKLN